MHIESRQNPIVKKVKSLHGAKGRLLYGLHLIEGEKVLHDAFCARMPIEELFVTLGREVDPALWEAASQAYTVTDAVMQALCDTVTPQGICATVRTPSLGFPAQFPAGMLVALDALQNPGNLGTILRAADAMGAAGILLGEGTADPFSPKCIRAAMGSTYHLPLWKGNLYEALQTLHHDGYCCICGHLQGVEVLPHPTDRCVIVIGNEGNGVNEDIAALCQRVRLPMYGKADSLNASMAAGLLMYEIAKMMHNKS